MPGCPKCGRSWSFDGSWQHDNRCFGCGYIPGRSGGWSAGSSRSTPRKAARTYQSPQQTQQRKNQPAQKSEDPVVKWGCIIVCAFIGGTIIPVLGIIIGGFIGAILYEKYLS